MILRTNQEIREIINRMNAGKEKHTDIYKDMNDRLGIQGIQDRQYRTKADLPKIQARYPTGDFSVP